MAFANKAAGLLVGMNMDPKVWHNVAVDDAELGWSSLLSLPVVHHSLRVNELIPNPAPATPASPKSPVDLQRFLVCHNQPYDMQWDAGTVPNRVVALDFGELCWMVKMLQFLSCLPRPWDKARRLAHLSLRVAYQVHRERLDQFEAWRIN